VHATIPKGNMGYDRYTVLTTSAVELACDHALSLCLYTVVFPADILRRASRVPSPRKVTVEPTFVAFL